MCQHERWYIFLHYFILFCIYLFFLFFKFHFYFYLWLTWGFYCWDLVQFHSQHWGGTWPCWSRTETGTKRRTSEWTTEWAQFFYITKETSSDLVVHDGAQAHDADVDVVLLTDQPGVFQCPAAGQSVTAEMYETKERKKEQKLFRQEEEPRCSLWMSLHHTPLPDTGRLLNTTDTWSTAGGRGPRPFY